MGSDPQTLRHHLRAGINYPPYSDASLIPLSWIPTRKESGQAPGKIKRVPQDGKKPK